MDPAFIAMVVTQEVMKGAIVARLIQVPHPSGNLPQTRPRTRRGGALDGRTFDVKVIAWPPELVVDFLFQCLALGVRSVPG